LRQNNSTPIKNKHIMKKLTLLLVSAFIAAFCCSPAGDAPNIHVASPKADSIAKIVRHVATVNAVVSAAQPITSGGTLDESPGKIALAGVGTAAVHA
jgi:hypothetical protein